MLVNRIYVILSRLTVEIHVLIATVLNSCLHRVSLNACLTELVKTDFL